MQPPRPIRYVMLGCTHFPFEAERIRAAFLRLRDVRDAAGGTPYRDLIATDLTLIDPAQLTAKELYRALFLARRLAPGGTASAAVATSARGTSSTAAEAVARRGDRNRLYVSVPAGDAPAATLTADGWYTHDYKYARAAGRFDVEDTRIVPLNAERMPSSIRTLIESRCPEVWRLLVQSP